MPPQTAQTLSNDDVRTFLSMDKDAQDKFINGLDESEQQQLLTGIQQYGEPAKSEAASTPGLPPPPQSNEFFGGFGRRAKQAWEGVKSLGAPAKGAENLLPPGVLQGERMARGAVGSEVTAGKQVAGQAEAGVKAAKVGDPLGAMGNFSRAAVTGASMLDPFATGSVTDINTMEDQGRNREALGTGAFDALTLLIGGLKSKTLTPQRSSMLMSGATGGDVLKYGQVVKDMGETAAALGKPTTVGGLAENLYKTGEHLETEFNKAKLPVANMKVMPTAIVSRLDKIISDHPNWAQTAAGRKMIRNINKVKIQYSKPWTIDQLNAERMDEGAGLRAYYGKDAGSKMGSQRTDIDMAVSKAVRDGSAEVVYGEVGRANPGLDVQALKNKQSAIIELRNQLEGKVDELANKQARSKTSTLREKVSPHAYVSPHRVGIYAGGMRPDVPPLDIANAKVARAFKGPATAGAMASGARRSIMTLPLSAMRAGHPQTRSAKPGTLPPPPEPAQ